MRKFEIYVDSYEVPGCGVWHGVGDLELVVDKMFCYGVSKEHVLELVYQNWNDPDEHTDWYYEDSDPFSVMVSVIK